MTNMETQNWFVGNSEVVVHPYTYGAEKIKVAQWGEGQSLVIGKFCSIAGGVIIFLGGNHRIDWISTYPFGHINTEAFGGNKMPGHPHSAGDVSIGNDVWIGQSVSILSGVTIGDGAVIAAHSHVCKDVEPYSIVGGNPAKLIKYRFSLEERYLLDVLKWWDLPEEEIKNIVGKLNSKPSVAILNDLIAKYR